MKNVKSVLILSALCALVCSGCATTVKRPPISYLSLEKPAGVIDVKKHNAVEKQFERGGFYIVNYNFRPAPDVASYIKETSQEAGSPILKNADIKFQVPFAVDILLFGYNAGTDVTTAGAE